MQINNYIDTSRNSMLDILFNFLNNSAGKGFNLQVITIYCLCEKLPMFPMKINVIVAVGTIHKDINAIRIGSSFKNKAGGIGIYFAINTFAENPPQVTLANFS